MILEDLKKEIDTNEAIMVYFGGDYCGVCNVLKPKIKKLFTKEFTKIKQIYISIDEFPQTAAQFNVLIMPTILVFFDQKEFIRQSRHISIQELSKQIQRPYGLFFN